MDKKDLFKRFKEIFGYEGENFYFSPGRINLIGEHTDYNGGKVFPSAITMGTYAVVKSRFDRKIVAYSENLPNLGILSFHLDGIEFKEENNWTNYIKGMLKFIQENYGQLSHGFTIYINGNISHGAGLSSSASIEVLIGVIANAEKDYAMLLNTSTLDYKQISLKLSNHKIVIMNSLARRELVDSEYNVRRVQCEEALAILQEVVPIKTLGDLTILEFETYKDVIANEEIRRRAQHAVYENVRTEKAARALLESDLETFGNLMNASHLSLHNDYEVMIAETNKLVRLAWEQDGVIGARMTGGGFGGSCLAIVENNQVETFKENVGQEYEEAFGYQPEFYIAETENRAQKL